MKERTYKSFRDVKRESFEALANPRRAEGGRVDIVVADDPGAFNEATGKRNQTRVQKTDGKNIASPSS
jgi:hypothetical protein